MKKYTITYIDPIGNIFVHIAKAENKGQALNELYELYMDKGNIEITNIDSEEIE
jgi:hypothetical protein